MQAYSSDQIVALVSCFVWQDRQERKRRLPEKLQMPFNELQQAARLVAKVSSHLPSALLLDLEAAIRLRWQYDWAPAAAALQGWLGSCRAGSGKGKRTLS